MIAVLYDPATGKILNTIQASEDTITRTANNSGAFVLQITPKKDDNITRYDTTHQVLGGKLVPLEE